MNKIRVRKRGSTFYFSFEAGRKPDGKRRTIEKGGFPDQQSAYDAGIKAYTDWKHGEVGITSERINIADYLSVYLNIREPELRAASSETYGSIALLINKYIGGIILQELRPRDVDSMFRKMAAAGKSKKTITLVKTVLRQALDYAVYPAELISSNPSAAIKVPRNAREKVVERVIIDSELLNYLLEEVWPADNWLHIFCLLAYHTGLRSSEICGLTWQDVDLDKGTLWVRRQLAIHKRVVRFGPPKTDTSEREIYLDTKIVGALRAWQREQKKQRLSGGFSYMLVFEGKDRRVEMESRNTTRLNPVNLICTTTTGGYCTNETVSAALSKEGLNSHSFRHTHATLLAEDSSISPKALAARLGHKNVNTTQNVYTHVTDKMREDTRESFQKIVDKMG